LSTGGSQNYNNKKNEKKGGPETAASHPPKKERKIAQKRRNKEKEGGKKFRQKNRYFKVKEHVNPSSERRVRKVRTDLNRLRLLKKRGTSKEHKIRQLCK